MTGKHDFSSVPAHQDLEKARENVRQARELLEEAQQEVLQAVYTIAIQTEDRIPLRDALIQEIYWADDVIPTVIAEVFGLSRPEVAKIAAKDYGIDLTCTRCQQTTFHPITSKTNLANIKVENHVCNECKERDREETHRHYEEWAQQHDRRIAELRTMPYQQYLQTPEWQQTRKDHLRRARYRCQVCNAGNTQLNVHHRTYERRGQEHIRDLIVLCRDCHEIFHQQGKLQDQ